MKVVRISDDMSELNFYVFDKSFTCFDKNVRKGMVVAIPLGVFEDGGARFFDSHKDVVVVLK